MFTQVQKGICLVFLSSSVLGMSNSVYANDVPLKAEMKVFQVDAGKKNKKDLKQQIRSSLRMYWNTVLIIQTYLRIV